MGQSLSNIILHLVFSTKDRRPLLPPHIRPPLYAYMHGILKNLGHSCVRIGGTADHVHVLVVLERSACVPDMVRQLKARSSLWLKQQGVAPFAWQAGYGVFSVSQRLLAEAVRYVARQEQHHERRSFQDEYRGLLRSQGVAYDEAYVWD